MNHDRTPSSPAHDDPASRQIADDDDDSTIPIPAATDPNLDADADADAEPGVADVDDNGPSQSRSRSRSRRRRRKKSKKDRNPGLVKKLSFVTHLLKTLDLLVFAELSGLYYMECVIYIPTRFAERC